MSRTRRGSTVFKKILELVRCLLWFYHLSHVVLLNQTFTNICICLFVYSFYVSIRVYVDHLHVGTHGGHQRGSEALELELYKVVSRPVGAGN